MLSKGDLIGIEGHSEKVKIIQMLGEGGQGIVYKVSFMGEEYALKWYHRYYLNEIDAKKFYLNLQNNILNGAPPNSSNLFLWPLYMTERTHGSFGYLMELRKPGFVEFKDILTAKAHCSINIRVKASLDIISAYRELYNRGYSYQDLNDGNCFINSKTGEIKICDNDNVCKHGSDAGIKGKPGYMAPEIVLGQASPSSLTDKHSLAVILFRMLCSDDPFFGKRVDSLVCLTNKAARFAFGEDPIFMFDPNDDRNRPVHGVHKDAITTWPCLPQYVKDAFIESFCVCAKNPDKRVEYMTWQKIFLRLKGDVLVCQKCGDDKFLYSEYYNSVNNALVCPNCGTQFKVPSVLKGRYCSLRLYPGAKIYNAHVKYTNSSETQILNEKNVIGEVVDNKKYPGYWGIKNMSKDNWVVTKQDGSKSVIISDQGFLIENNIRVEVNGSELQVVQA